jgi:hypothetical protein
MPEPDPLTGRPYMPGYGITPATEGGDPLPWSWAVERLEASRNLWLTTVRESGVPHVRPVWGVWLDGTFMFSTGSTPRDRALARDPRIVINTERADEAVIVEGEAERLESLAGLEGHVAAYEQKYSWTVDPAVGTYYLVRPVVAFGFVEAADEFSRRATRWRFEQPR